MDNCSKIAIAIAEDDMPIRQLLCSYLETFPDLEIVGSFSSGTELLDLISYNGSNITAVFLDIEMPDLDGLTVASKIKDLYPDIFIIFVTAHTKYAADSYKLDAIDYIVKPVTSESLAKSINKIKRFMNLNPNDKKENSKKILVNNNHEIYLLNINDIIFIEKELKKTIIHTKKGIYTTIMPLHIIESLLGNRFFRCHKGFIINQDEVEKIVPTGDRVYEIHFYNYKPTVTMRRQKYEEFLSLMTNKI